MVDIKIGYLGPPGTYSHEAARQQFEPFAQLNDDILLSYLPQSSISSCFKSIQDGEVDYSLVPFENSSNGQVVLTYDLFRDWFTKNTSNSSKGHEGKVETNFHVIAEQFVAIHHNLITYSKDLNQITKFYSHPQVWSQCLNFFENNQLGNFTKIEKIDTSSTSKAVEILKNCKNDDEKLTSAAIASRTASEIHGVPILKTNIEDHEGNTTRFLVLGKKKTGLQDVINFRPDGIRISDKKICLLNFIIKNNDNFGSLCDILEHFKKHNLNLQTITTRPSVVSPWRYVFFVEVWHGEGFDQCLKELSDLVLELSIVGSFYRSEKFFKMISENKMD